MPRTWKIAAALALAIAATATLAGASDHGRGRGEDEEHEERGDREHGGGRRAGVEGEARVDPRAAPPEAHAAGAATLYRKECGACHLAFPPGMLPAESHRRVLAGLERHFGQNAELDAGAREQLERYLVANAAGSGGHRQGGPPGADGAPLRITELPSFRRRHREVRPDVFTRASIRSPANCAACHRGAADWDFDEDRVKIPR
jgi:hypothetical protein